MEDEAARVERTVRTLFEAYRTADWEAMWRLYSKGAQGLFLWGATSEQDSERQGEAWVLREEDGPKIMQRLADQKGAEALAALRDIEVDSVEVSVNKSMSRSSWDFDGGPGVMVTR